FIYNDRAHPDIYTPSLHDALPIWQPAERIARLREPARRLLGDVGLATLAHHVAARMSHGQHRQLEIGMALATRPSMLLLDEPMRSEEHTSELQSQSNLVCRLLLEK